MIRKHTFGDLNIYAFLDFIVGLLEPIPSSRQFVYLDLPREAAPTCDGRGSGTWVNARNSIGLLPSVRTDRLLKKFRRRSAVLGT